MVKKLYSYNKGSHLLHITNGCKYSNGSEYIQFDTEDEALCFAGRHLGMCKDCMEKRDEILRKAFLEKKGD